jgi:hypothetical protein
VLCVNGAEVTNVASVATEVTGIVVEASQPINRFVVDEVQVVTVVTILSQLNYLSSVMIRLCNSWVKSFVETHDVSM